MTLSSLTIHSKAHETAESHEPSSDQLINLISPNSSNNRQLLSPTPRIYTSSSNVSDSESQGSYSGYSLGGVINLAHSNSISKKKILLKSSQSYHSSLNTKGSGDKEFNFGHGQVQKMQSLLEEYQNSITALEIEKADNQQEINKLDKRLKEKGETEERYKEEIWNLELSKQELLQKINDLNQHLQRSSSEQTRLEREQLVLEQELEQLKAVQQFWEHKLKETKENHELEIISFKKLLHTSRLEKESLSREIQDLISQHATAMATTTLRHVVEDKINDTTNISYSASVTAVAPAMALSTNNSSNRNNTVEIDALKASLNQAHEIIRTMQEKIDIERDERIEVDTLLREAQETIESFHSTIQYGSNKWYSPPQQQSPTTSAHSIPCNNNNSSNRNLLSPTSSLTPMRRESSRKKRFASAAASRSPYPPIHHIGKFLCDELSQAGSVGNFKAPPMDVKISDSDNVLPKSLGHYSSSYSLPLVAKDNQQVSDSNQLSPTLATAIGIKISAEIFNSHSNDNISSSETIRIQSIEEKGLSSAANIIKNDETKPTSVELTHVDLPSISNHEIYSSFSSGSNSSSKEEDDNYNEEIKLLVQQENYGSLLKNPESYIYKSKRTLLNEKKKVATASASTLFSSTTADTILNSKLKQEVSSRDSEEDGSVTTLIRTMIGDWMWKYTRKVVGSGISENRHLRFFWIHPYTQTLYWSSKEPGSSSKSKSPSSTKSALVESFVVLDNQDKSIPPSILIKTPARGLKVQCEDIASHLAWLKSLRFLLADSNANSNQNNKQPNLSRFSSVSKHYLNRKKSQELKKKENVSLSSFPPPLPLINGGGGNTDLLPFNPPSVTIFNSNFLTHL